MYYWIFISFLLLPFNKSFSNQKMEENVEFKAIVEIEGHMAIGWGYKIRCRVLEIKSGELPKLKSYNQSTDIFILGWTAGFKGKTGKKGTDFQEIPPIIKEKYLMTFLYDGTLNEKAYDAPVTGFTDSMDRIWFLKELQKINP